MSKIQENINTRLQFCEIELTQYSGQVNKDHSQILRTLIDQIMRDRLEKLVKFFDRNLNNDREPRYIGILNSVYIARKSIIRGKMALLRSKSPVLINDNYDIERIKELENKKFAEISHFCIDYSGSKPIMLFERNQNGPTLSDMEYFFRHYGKTIRKAKFCTIRPFIDSISDNIIDDITNIEFIDLRINEQKQEALKNVSNSYYSGANLINRITPYKSIRISTSYNKENTPPQTVQFAKDLFRRLLKYPSESEEYELLQVSYETNNSGDFCKFDLIRDKKEVNILTKISSPGVADSKELFSKMIEELENFQP